MRRCTDPLALDPISPIAVSPITDISSTTGPQALRATRLRCLLGSRCIPMLTVRRHPGRADSGTRLGTHPDEMRCALRQRCRHEHHRRRPSSAHRASRRTVEVSAEVIEVTGDGLRIAEVGLVILLGLLVCPPLLILAVVVAVPVIAISAVVAAVVGRDRGADRARAPRARPPPRARLDALPAPLAVVIPGRPPARHLRPRGEGIEQPITTVELFFDLVYVFAVTQLSHMILGDLTVAGVGRAAFLLLIVWWAWIYTTWMANWFDPASPAVRAVLTGVMLASLLMAAALPGAFGAHGVLFAVSYVALQVGRNAAAASLLGRDRPLRDVFERLVGWSAASGVLWLAGAALPGDRRLLLWIPAVVLDLCAPVAGYWLPRRGRAVTTDYDIEGGHFTDRCQGFIIIALGESIVVTGATAADAGLSSTVVLCLGIAFLETAALWWLYFGAVAERSRLVMSTCEDPGRLARDAYTYLHAPIVAGIIAVAVGDDLLIAEPGHALHGVGLAMVLGGPVLYLVGESLFRLRVTGTANAKRLAVAAILVLLAPLGSQISALALSATVAALLSALALWELRPLAHDALGTRLGTPTDAPRGLMGDLRPLQQQQEGTS